MDEPSIGRVVHYVAYGTPGGEFPSGVCRAAVITEVMGEGVVNLMVANPTGVFFNLNVPYGDVRLNRLVQGKDIPVSEHRKPGTWHWPERV